MTRVFISLYDLLSLVLRQLPTALPAQHINRGNRLFDKRDFDGSIAEYDKAIAIDPNNPDHYYNRGNARKAKKEFDLAISDYNKALSINANFVEAYNNRGNARSSTR